MDQDSIQAIVGALNQAQVRYLIAGGLAVVAHGYVRFTADLVQLKRQAGRPVDLDDIARLEAIRPPPPK